MPEWWERREGGNRDPKSQPTPPPWRLYQEWKSRMAGQKEKFQT